MTPTAPPVIPQIISTLALARPLVPITSSQTALVRLASPAKVLVSSASPSLCVFPVKIRYITCKTLPVLALALIL
jgi:hypothetical protein